MTTTRTAPATAPTLFRAPTADGRMMYPAPVQTPFDGFVAWVTPVAEIRASSAHNAQRLLIVDAAATEIEYTVWSAVKPTIIRWTRDRESAAFPAEILPADWAAFRESLGHTGSDYDEYVADGMYTAQFTDREQESRTIDLSVYTDLPFDILDITSIEDPDVSFTWQVSAPHLIFGDMYAAVMPGALTDLYERFAKDAEAALPGVKIWTHKAREGVVSGHVELRYEDNRTFSHKVGRRTVTLPRTMNHSFEIPVPKIIVGTSKVDAIAKYRTVLDEVLSQIADRKAVTCGHCDGAGLIVD